MTEQGFPVHHQTTTTTTTTTTNVTVIRLDFGYISTVPGILKCIQIALNLLGFICIISTIWRYHSRGTWFNTVAMGGFWFTGIMLALYLFHVTDKLRVIPWIKIEFFFCALWTFFYLIAASLAADFGQIESFAAAAFFGFCAMIVYGYDAFLKFTQLSGDIIVFRTTPTNQTA